MYVFAGLGNPGVRYANNRHNIGYMVADEIARRHGFEEFRSRSRLSGDIAEGRIGDARAVLLKPTTFMNESGRALGAVMRFYKVTPAEVFIFHDELDLAPGKVRVKRGGGSAGHNGLKSITSHIGANYWRVRMGIGRPSDKGRVHSYVLSDFFKAESAWLDKLVDATGDAASLLLGGKENDFMTRVAYLAPPLTKAMKPAKPNKNEINEEE